MMNTAKFVESNGVKQEENWVGNRRRISGGFEVRNPDAISPGDETIHLINQHRKELRATSGGGRFYQK